MREPYTQLFVHLVWSTWDRLPLVTPTNRERIYACMRAQCLQLGARLIAVGGTQDHVHVLVQLPVTLPVAELAKQLKGSSSHLVQSEIKDEAFKWQGGYGAFTVSKALGPTVREYILRQQEHHSQGSTSKDMEVAWEERSPLPDRGD